MGEVVLERLKAVAAHNELGAGMAFAMKDLEIRGAGNMLGGEQSGHIQGLGFDPYLRLVGEAVAEFRGHGKERVAEMKIELRPASINLIAVAHFKVLAREAGLTDVALQGNFIEFAPAYLPESKEMRRTRMYPGSLVKPALNSVLIPKPKTARIGGRDLADAEVLKWAQDVLEAIFDTTPASLYGQRRGGPRFLVAAGWSTLAVLPRL